METKKYTVRRNDSSWSEELFSSESRKLIKEFIVDEKLSEYNNNQISIIERDYLWDELTGQDKVDYVAESMNDEVIKIGDLQFDKTQIIKECDPIAWNEILSDSEDHYNENVDENSKDVTLEFKNEFGGVQ